MAKQLTTEMSHAAAKRGERNKMHASPDQQAMMAEASSQAALCSIAVVRWLCVPTDRAPTWIPLGMSEEDFQMLKATLELWRSRIVAPPKEESDSRHDDERKTSLETA